MVTYFPLVVINIFSSMTSTFEYEIFIFWGNRKSEMYEFSTNELLQLEEIERLAIEKAKNIVRENDEHIEEKVIINLCVITVNGSNYINWQPYKN